MKIVETLNTDYGSLIVGDHTISSAYSKLVETRAPRVLAKVDYNLGVPFRSARCTDPAKETDVSLMKTT